MRRLLVLAVLAILVLPSAAYATAGTNLTNAGASVYDSAAAFSPDGSAIAFLSIDGTQSSAASLMLMDPNGGNVRAVAAGVADGLNSGGIVWSPDGTLIAVNRDDANHGPDSSGRDPFVVSVADGSVRVIDLGLDNGDTARPVGFTPTNQLALVVMRCGPTTCGQEIAVAQPGATTASTIYTLDASHIVDTAVVDNTGEIGVDLSDVNTDAEQEIVLSPSGTLLHTLALTSNDQYATLSPDGTKLAFGRFVHNSDSLVDLYVVNIDGTGQRALTSDGFAPNELRWSPDGTRIAYQWQESDTSTGNFLSNGVHVVSVTGGDDQSLVQTDDPLALDSFSASGQALFHFYNPDFSTCTQGPVWRVCTQDVFSAFASATPNTPAGTNVAVNTGSGAALTFSTVSSGGDTTATSGSTGPTPPSGYTLGSPAVFYNLQTTATYSGAITVCIDTTGVTFSGLPGLFHYEGGAWVDVTTSSSGNQVCGQVTSLSPFAVFGRPYSVRVLTDLSKPFAAGSTLTVKLKVMAGASDVSSSGVLVTATTLDSGVPQADGNQGNVFKYNDKTYSYNLKTKGLKAGGHTLGVTIGSSPTPFSIAFTVK